MPPAVTLLEAADDAAVNLAALWAADTLQAKMISFWQEINPQFPEQDPANVPIANWIAIIAAFAPSILDYADTQDGTITTYELAVDYIYRLCRFGQFYPLLSSDGYNALLDAYNTAFT